MFAANFLKRFEPLDDVDAAALADSKRWLVRNGIAAQVMETLAVGTFLTAFALSLGASNAFIGLVAALPHLASLLQLVGVVLVERLRNRRLICVSAAAMGRLTLWGLPIAAFMGEPEVSLTLLFAAMCVRYAMGAFVTCSWNPWIRDLIPDQERGKLMSRRLSYMLAMGMVVGLAGSVFIDTWPDWSGRPANEGYGVLFLGACIAGIVSLFSMANISEPRMPKPEGSLNLVSRLSAPFKDENFRRLMFFLATWNFAANLAAPFFTVHMLTRLGLDLFPVTVLAVLSQLTNVIVLQSFGRIADRVSNKAVLAASAPFFIACTFAWVFTTATETRWAVLAILAGVHIFTGFATAGVSIATANIAMKLAPYGNSTAYLAANSLVSWATAGAAPMIGGLCADFFAHQKLSLVLRWQTDAQDLTFETISIEHWDFYFVLAALVGVYSLHRLAMVREEGEIDQRAILAEVLADARRTIRNVSSIAGLRVAAGFPFYMLRRHRDED